MGRLLIAALVFGVLFAAADSLYQRTFHPTKYASAASPQQVFGVQLGVPTAHDGLEVRSCQDSGLTVTEKVAGHHVETVVWKCVYRGTGYMATRTSDSFHRDAWLNSGGWHTTCIATVLRMKDGKVQESFQDFVGPSLAEAQSDGDIETMENQSGYLSNSVHADCL